VFGAGQEFDQLVVVHEIAAEATIRPAAGERGVVIFAVHAEACLLIVAPGEVHRAAGADEPDVDFPLVPASPQRPRPVQRDAGLGVHMLVVLGEQQGRLLHPARGQAGPVEFQRGDFVTVRLLGPLPGLHRRLPL
jgi:hypothetical protein